jgi:hypothetical protein
MRTFCGLWGLARCTWLSICFNSAPLAEAQVRPCRCASAPARSPSRERPSACKPVALPWSLDLTKRAVGLCVAPRTSHRGLPVLEASRLISQLLH